MGKEPYENLFVEQFKAALDLYKHEDQLNWQKINLLIYSNSILFAGIALSKENIESIKKIVSFVGFSISFCFLITILFGILYLKQRKQKVGYIEEKLSQKTHVKIFKNKTRYLETSPSTIILMILPLIFCVLWVIIFLN